MKCPKNTTLGYNMFILPCAAIGHSKPMSDFSVGSADKGAVPVEVV